jgi:hypothetical protein
MLHTNVNHISDDEEKLGQRMVFNVIRKFLVHYSFTKATPPNMEKGHKNITGYIQYAGCKRYKST